jgi:HAD superfamily hydrolase (TIGR01662 family)
MARHFFLILLALFPVILHAEETPALIRRTMRNPFHYAGGEVPVAFLDADSNVRIPITGWYAPRTPEEVVLLPGVARKIRELTEQGFFVTIVSNQKTILASGATLENVDKAMEQTARLMESEGGKVHLFNYALTEAESKPSPAMFQELEKQLLQLYGPQAKIDKARSFMVGDYAYQKPGPNFAGELRPNGLMGEDEGNFDRLFAKNNGIAYHEPNDFFGWEKYGIYRFHKMEDIDRYEYNRSALLRGDPPCPDAYAIVGAGKLVPQP